MRDFESIVAFLSDREIEEMQAAIDARREARAGPSRPERDGRRPFRAKAVGSGAPEGGRRAS